MTKFRGTWKTSLPGQKTPSKAHRTETDTEPTDLTFGFTDHHVAELTLAALIKALHLNVIGGLRLQVVDGVPISIPWKRHSVTHGDGGLVCLVSTGSQTQGWVLGGCHERPHHLLSHHHGKELCGFMNSVTPK